jgi:hypothetical protein
VIKTKKLLANGKKIWERAFNVAKVAYQNKNVIKGLFNGEPLDTAIPLIKSVGSGIFDKVFEDKSPVNSGENFLAGPSNTSETDEQTNDVLLFSENSENDNVQNRVRQQLQQNKKNDNNNFNNKDFKMPVGGDAKDVHKEITKHAETYFNGKNNNYGGKNSNKNEDDLTAFIKLKKLLGIPLTPWENYMNGINSYQQNIQHFQNMMNGLGKLGSGNNTLLPLMMMGGCNFVNTLKKQKFSRDYIDLKIKNNIPLTAQEKQFYCNQVIRKTLNSNYDPIDQMIGTLNQVAEGDGMSFEDNSLLNGFFNFGGSGGSGFNLFKNNKSDFPTSTEDILTGMLNKKGKSISFGGATGTRTKRRYRRRTTTTAAPKRTYRRRRTTTTSASAIAAPIKEGLIEDVEEQLPVQLLQGKEEHIVEEGLLV